MSSARSVSVVIGCSLLLNVCGGRVQSNEGSEAMAGRGGLGGDRSSAVAGSGAGNSVGGSTGGARSTVGCTDAIVETNCEPRQGMCLLLDVQSCAGNSFICPVGEAAFFDVCGCGCKADPFSDSSGTPYPADRSDLCNGPNGPLALFETAPSRIVIGSTQIYVWVSAYPSTEPTLWAIDKRTGAVSVVPSGSDLPQAMPQSVVSSTDAFSAEYEVAGTRYTSRTGTTLLATSNGWTESLFDIPNAGDDSLAFIVVDHEFYSTSSDGALFLGHLPPTVSAPVMLEQRGTYDDDDYDGILGADPDAVYWLAGAFADGRTQDHDPLALYRTCRSR